MADIIRNNILNNIITVLRGITTLNGYNLNLKSSSVSKHVRSWAEVSSAELPLVFVSDGDEERNYDAMGSRVTHLFGVKVRGIVESQQDASNELNKLLIDVESALVIDLRRGVDSNGQPNAGNTTIERIYTDQGLMNPRAVFEMDVLVTFYTLDTDR